MKKGIVITAIIGAVIAVFISSPVKKTIQTMRDNRTRGLRNNNPFNMNRNTTKWQGLVNDPTEKRFCVFESMELGVRAGLINLYNGYFSKNLNLLQLISKYAPSFENDVLSYVNSVAERANIENPLAPVEKSKWFEVASAILRHENGVNVYSAAQLKNIAKMYNLNYL